MRVGRSALAGASVGATLGLLFGVAVVSFADCAGPNCTYERVIGVVAHVAVGGGLGAALGGLLAAVARLVRRLRV